MNENQFKEHVRFRIEQMLDVLAHMSFGKLDVPVPEVPDDDEFADLFIGLDVLLADLREARNELEEQIRERTKEIQESFRQRETAQLRAEQLESLGTLAGGIAHDFNNCLTAITGCLSLAKRMVKDDPKLENLLTSVMDSAFGATSLTKQLLTFSKGGEPVKKCLYIQDLVKRVSEFCVRGSNSRCIVEIDSEIRPVEVDAGQIEQVIGNIVINATQAMPRGGEVKVRISNEERPNNKTDGNKKQYVCILVEDGGEGISEENLDKIYDPYFSTKTGGSGLGLATAYSVVKKHGGFMECDSYLGGGSIFRIYLPASKMKPESRQITVPSSPMGKGRVLVMDDDHLVRQVAVEILKDAGYDITAVETGTEAVRVYTSALDNGRQYDIALLDLTVPGGEGGKETIKRLLEIDPNAKGIVVSGYSDDPVLANYQDYGFVAQLSKPYRVEQLLEVIGEIID